MLEELYSETDLLKDVIFRPGINIILGKYAHSKQESGINGIGKSSLIRLIDYLLLSDGADKIFSNEKYAFLWEEGHTATLKLKILGETHYIHRSFGKKKNLVGFGKSANQLVDYDLRELRSILLGKLFPITNELVQYEGERFRTLFNFFIKDDLDQRQRKDPLDFTYFRTIAERLAYNFFLLDIPNRAIFACGAQIKLYSEKNSLVKSLQEKIQISTGKKTEEFKSERVAIEQRVTLLEKSLRDYKFLEKYKDIEANLSGLNDSINERLKALHSMSRKLKRLRDLNEGPNTINVADIHAMFRELSDTFASLVEKKLEEIITFKQSLFENRKRQNLEREKQIVAAIQRIEADISLLENQRAALLHQLEEKGELDCITNTYEELVSEKIALEKNVLLLRQIDDINVDMQQIDIRISEEKIAIYHAIQQSEEMLDELRSLFREIIENAILLRTAHEGSAYFDISTIASRNRNQLPINVKVEVPKSDALGRFNLKLVAYDLLVFLHAARTGRQLPRFLVHDGVYHGTSRRTTTDTLNFIQRQSQLYPGIQYIVTFNEDELYVPEERKELDGTLQFNLEDTVVARYTDTDKEMIFKRAFG
jgi:uncharacterized protein YydD (DUF2326 family)